MADEESQNTQGADGENLEEESGKIYQFERWLMGLGSKSEVMMDVLELATAFIMILLFSIGVFDLGLKLFQLVESGAYTKPDKIIKLIDTALLLLIIVEIYRTVIAYVEDLNILPIVLNVAIIAMARKIISFRAGKYATPEDAILSALSYGLLMLIIVVSFYLIHWIQQNTGFNIYSAGEQDEFTSG